MMEVEGKPDLSKLTGREKYENAISNAKKRAVTLIETHGMDVKFIVPNDPYIFEEIVEPSLIIDEGLALAYQLEHRVIDSKDLKKLKDKYFTFVEAVKILINGLKTRPALKDEFEPVKMVVDDDVYVVVV